METSTSALSYISITSKAIQIVETSSCNYTKKRKYPNTNDPMLIIGYSVTFQRNKTPTFQNSYGLSGRL